MCVMDAYSMSLSEFEEFMKAQVAFFKLSHGDCKDLTADQISEDSIEFRRRWSTQIHGGVNESIRPENKDID